MNLFDLTHQTAVIIGGTGSLGGAIAHGLAQAGARVLLLGRSQKNGQTQTQTINSQNPKTPAQYIPADATDPANLQQAAQTIQQQHGPPHILINAAGGNQPQATITPDNPIQNLPLKTWHDNLRLNLDAGILIPCQTFGPQMIAAQRGAIINIASIAAHKPLSRVPAYSAAKAALHNLTQYLAREWAPHNIRVNTITPGFIPAQQNQKLLQNPDGTPTPRAQAILAHTPMKRFGQPHELIGATLLLASTKASSYITGADIRIDGGFLTQTI